MLHPAIRLGPSAIQGIGLIADRPISWGEIVWALDRNVPIWSLSDVELWPRERQEEFDKYSFQCGEDRFALTDGAERYMNHSCDPNTWWMDDTTLVACRDIQVSEEVTYDYTTCDIARQYTRSCNCGSKYCRKTITNNDYLDAEWQRKHGTHLPSFVLRAIEKQKNTNNQLKG